jgi:hypothetical protein
MDEEGYGEVAGISVSSSGQATVDPSLANILFDLALNLEVTPYLGPESNHVTNGLLLRADIHTLLDLNLIGIDPESLQVVVGEQLQATCYEELDGQELIVPDDDALAPSKEALGQRWERFNKGD